MDFRCRSSNIFIKPKTHRHSRQPILLDSYKYDGHVLFFSNSALPPKSLSSPISHASSPKCRGSEQRAARYPNTKTSPRIRSPPTTATQKKNNLRTPIEFQQRKSPPPATKDETSPNVNASDTDESQYPGLKIVLPTVLSVCLVVFLSALVSQLPLPSSAHT